MLTQKQVALELIGHHIQAYRDLDVKQVYGERIAKAQALLETGAVTGTPQGTYHVKGSQPDPYLVSLNGGTGCTCVDYARAQAPNGWCKHRIAAKVFTQVRDALQEQVRGGIPHLHYACEHKAMQELCWAPQCPAPMDQLCDACLEDALDRSLPDDSEEQLPTEVTLAPEAMPLEPLQTAQYEPNPTPEYVCQAPGKGRKVALKPFPTAEAPASLNLQLTLPGGGKLMYTMRSMLPGAGGDLELQARLPQVLTYLEGLGLEQATPQGSWWKRLLQSCRLSSGTGQETS